MIFLLVRSFFCKKYKQASKDTKIKICSKIIEPNLFDLKIECVSIFDISEYIYKEIYQHEFHLWHLIRRVVVKF